MHIHGHTAHLAAVSHSPQAPFFSVIRLLCSSKIASHAVGVSGCDLLTYLSHFLRELNADARYLVNASKRVMFDPRFVEMFGSVKIPFLAPMGTPEWDPEFAARLDAAVGEVHLGIAYPSLKNSRADLEVYDWDASDLTPSPGGKPDRPPLLVAQARLYKDNVGEATFAEKILPSFSKYSSCSLFIVVAPGFADMDDLVHQDYCVWKFAKFGSRKRQKVEQVLLNSLQSPLASKHVLLCSLQCSTEVRSRLAEKKSRVDK